jgi:hypothetical protein
MALHHSKAQPRKGGKFYKASDEGRLPVDQTLPSPDPESTIAVGGTAVYGGYLQPNETNAELTGRAKYKLFSDAIANVAIIAAGVRLLLNLVANAEWKAEAPKDSGEEGEEFAQRALDTLNDMRRPWHRVVRRLAGHRFHGFAAGEWVAKRNEDGGIGFKDVIALPQVTIQRWHIDNDGWMAGCIQTSPQTGKDVSIPREKMVYVVDDALNDSPEGLGLLRHVSDSVKRLQRLQELEQFGYAGDLRGIPIGRAPLMELDKAVKAKTITKARAEELVAGLEAFVKSHIKNPDLGMLLDSTPYKGTGENRTPVAALQWGIELLDGGSYSLDAVAKAIVRIQREIARVLGVEHLMLGENSAGSRSLSEDKTQAFALLVDGTLKEIRTAVEKDMLEPLWELNGWPKEMMPKLKTEAVAFRSVAEMASAIRDMAVAGVQLDRQDEAVNEVLDLMGLTRLAKLETIDTDLLLSAEDAQAQAMATMEATAKLKTPGPNNPPAKVEKVLLSPNAGESRSDFVSRFMGSKKAREEFPDQAQRAAVANQRFRDK